MLTVCGERNSCAAAARFDNPWATRRTTATSESVRPSHPVARRPDLTSRRRIPRSRSRRRTREASHVAPRPEYRRSASSNASMASPSSPRPANSTPRSSSAEARAGLLGPPASSSAAVPSSESSPRTRPRTWAAADAIELTSGLRRSLPSASAAATLASAWSSSARAIRASCTWSAESAVLGSTPLLELRPICASAARARSGSPSDIACSATTHVACRRRSGPLSARAFAARVANSLAWVRSPM